jgi:hypothetical protein
VAGGPANDLHIVEHLCRYFHLEFAPRGELGPQG